MTQLELWPELSYWLLSRPAREAEAAKAQLEKGTFAGQPSMIDCLERIVRRGGR